MKFTATAQAAMQRNLDTLIRSIVVPPVLQAVDACCDLILNQAMANAPIRSGDLKNSGRKSVEENGLSVVGTVAFTAPWSAFVEFGTGVRGRGTYPYPLPQSGVPFTGKWIYDYKNQNWQGMVSQAFLRPALDTVQPQILEQFRKLTVRV